MIDAAYTQLKDPVSKTKWDPITAATKTPIFKRRVYLTTGQPPRQVERGRTAALD